MKNKQKGFIMPALIFIIVLVVGGGVYVYQNKNKEITDEILKQLEVPVSEQTNNQSLSTDSQNTSNINTSQTSDTALEWKSYKNDKLGVEFMYPPNYKIVTDKVQIEYKGHPKGYNWYRIELVDESSAEKPFIRFEVDSDGYGPFFPDKRYDIKENNGGVTIVNTTENNDEYTRDGKILIIPSFLEASNGHTYYWQFSFNESGKDHENTFKQILSTYRFTN